MFRQLLVVVPLVTWIAASARAEIRPDFEMDGDPEIHVPATVMVFSKRLKPLWLQALARPDADMQRLAADAIGRGHEGGMPGMDEAVPGLIAILTSPSSHPAARLAAAQALVKLDAKQAAKEMAGSAETQGAELRQVVEPALASWNYEPQRAVWQARLTAPGVRHRDLVLAIRCLATAHDGSRVAALLDLVHDRFRPPAVRSEAARAAGLLQERDLEAEAGRLLAGAASTPILNRLWAGRLRARQAGDAAQRLLAQLAVDP
ncbi:MAG: HEAT repeat domain-containing protein, partial [Deltaproteobacteria bacterium]